VLLAFNNTQVNGVFAGSISDPLPLQVGHEPDGLPRLEVKAHSAS
jgi:beta-fructofuranosidase